MITEALNNTLKHANAKQVEVKVWVSEGYLMIIIKDDGTGFDITRDSPGMGLENMRTRANNIGGHLEINSNNVEGTRVSIKVKLENPDEM